MNNKDEEEVLVVKTKVLFPGGMKDGLFDIGERRILKTVVREGVYMKRKYCETDPDWQQIIAQISLIVGNKIFIYRFPQTATEKRLTDMWPIFLGGHVNNLDGSFEDAMKREFDEEIIYKGNILRKTFLGMIKQTEPLVNKVHTGLAWVYEGDSEDFELTDDNGVADGKFINFNEVGTYLPKMSYWSQIAAPVIVKKFVR